MHARKITSYLHQIEQPTEQPDTAPGPYFVSVRDDGRFGLLLGPFNTHKEALDRVDAVRAKAIELNPWAHFYSFGTVRMKPTFKQPGRLNQFFEKEKTIENSNGKTSSPRRR